MKTGYERWPGYCETKPRTRQLVLLQTGDEVSISDSRILLSSGEVVDLGGEGWQEGGASSLWQRLKAWAFSLAVLPDIYCTDIVSQPWAEEAFNDPQVTAVIPANAMLKLSMVQCLKVKKGRQSVWIISSRAWNTPQATPAFLAELEALFELCQVGERPTPGSLGQALMRDGWQREKRRWVSRPSNAARVDLLKHSLGGRVDYWTTPKERFEQVFESDVNGAYGSVCEYLPGGTQVNLNGEPGKGQVVSYFMQCEVRILEGAEPPIGVFGQKGPAGTNEYPTAAGTYQTWLWKEEVDACRSNNILVLPRSGYGWTSWNHGLGTWAQRMFSLRLRANEINSTLSAWLKVAMVSALGRFGMPLWNWSIRPEHQAEDGDLALMHEMSETGLVLHRVTQLASNHLSHWYSYILMRARLVLRSRMLFEMQRGNRVLASNYDAIYCLLPTDPIHLGKGLGQWKQTMLSKVRFPFPRGIISQEKKTLPGTKRE